MRWSLPATFASLAAFFLILSGCKDSILEPERFGTIQGQILDFETSKPLAGASITTSPPTGAIVTDAQGRFSIDDVLVGNYTITGKKTGYDPSTVTIAVQSNRATQATLFLSPEDSTGSNKASVSVEVLNFISAIGRDSTNLRVQYRVRNTGKVNVNTYELYFRIETTGNTYFDEQNGTNLNVGQADIGEFSQYIGRDSATAVVVDTFFIDG